MFGHMYNALQFVYAYSPATVTNNNVYNRTRFCVIIDMIIFVKEYSCRIWWCEVI